MSWKIVQVNVANIKFETESKNNKLKRGWLSRTFKSWNVKKTKRQEKIKHIHQKPFHFFNSKSALMNHCRGRVERFYSSSNKNDPQKERNSAPMLCLIKKVVEVTRRAAVNTIFWALDVWFLIKVNV